MTHPPKVLERTNAAGVSRTERDRLVDDFENYLLATCGDGRATKITVTIAVEAKGAA